MKYISIEEFISNLKSVPSGVEYLNLVMNNQIPKDNDGEDHHIYMKSICGNNKELYRLSYYNHILAHIYLTKASLEGNYKWQNKALCALNALMMNTYKHLSDIEKITVDEILYISELRKLSHKATGKILSERWDNLSDSEKEEHANRSRRSARKYYDNETEEHKEKRKESQRNRTDHNKIGLLFKDRIYINNGKKNKRVKQEELDSYLSTGEWVRGEIADRSNVKPNTKGTIYINNGKKNKRVKPEELDNYLSTGEWIKGMLVRRKKKSKEELLIINSNLSNVHKGSIYMTSNNDNHIYQVIPRKQQEFYNKGYFRCNMKGIPWEIAIKKKPKKKRICTEEYRKKRSDSEIGIIYMTDGICKPKRIVLSKQQEFFTKGWYRCNQKGIPWEQSVKFHQKSEGGYIFMTDGTCKPTIIYKTYQQEYFDKGWYRCHRNSIIPW